MKIVVNKTFNKVFAFEYLNCTMKPNTAEFAATSFIIYDDLNNNRSTKNGSFPLVLFAPKALLDVIDIINAKLYVGTFTGSVDTDVSADILIGTLFNAGRTERNSALDYLQRKSIISAELVADVKAMTTKLIGFDYTQFVRTYDDIEDVYKFAFETPTELEVPYDQANNPRNNKLYLVFPSLVNVTYGSVIPVATSNGKYSPLHKFYNPIRDLSVPQSSYIATELGDIVSETADLKYDHMDKIEYLDSFRLRFKLPRVIQ